MRYNTYSNALIQRFGEKVYKIPVNMPLSCPNRDGTCGFGGCSFCGDVGTGFENLEASESVADQLKKNMAYIGPKYKAEKFIAYFNNFSNTYCKPSDLDKFTREACVPGVVGICVSTRPDCVSEEHLQILSVLAAEKGVEITLELGLQTVNYHTLQKINRGHSLAEFVDAVLRIKKRGFRVCGHLIGNLPWDDDTDMREGAKLFSALGVDEVKIHTLYILKGTQMARQYEAGEFEINSVENYVNRVVDFIRHSSPEMVFQRFAGRAPEEETIFCNWGMSWWKIKDMIDTALEVQNVQQGDLCHYLNGSAVRKFL